MKELSLNILDIAQNSVVAGASCLTIGIRERDGLLTLSMADDGHGMDAELLAKATDPFTTTRSTRKIGMGLPLLRLAAEQTGGELQITSTPKGAGEAHGTWLTACFYTTHVDCMPLGDMVETLLTLVSGSPDMDLVFTHERDGRMVELDTRQMREMLGEVPLNEPEVLAWAREMLTESYSKLPMP